MPFLTDNARIEQTDKAGIWKTLDNQLYKDEDGSIYLVPRYYLTDNYTIPDWLAWLGGNKSKWDVRPSHFHDFGCAYRKLIKVNLNETQLRMRRLLHVKNNRVVCENIPIKWLEVVSVDKWFIDCMFKRMMIDTYNIPKWRVNMMRFAVFFNVGWLANYNKDINLEEIYNDKSLQ